GVALVDIEELVAVEALLQVGLLLLLRDRPGQGHVGRRLLALLLVLHLVARAGAALPDLEVPACALDGTGAGRGLGAALRGMLGLVSTAARGRPAAAGLTA